MMPFQDWGADTLQQIATLSRAHADVRALAVLGSEATGAADRWSDLDLLLVVRDHALDKFFPPFDWLTPLGQVYASELHPGPHSSTARICFVDLRRMDLIVTTETSLANYREWPGWPFADGNRIVFSRDPAIDVILGAPLDNPAPTVAEDALERLANGFWFKGSVAVLKVVRGDRLVAFHLGLAMIQDVAVLAMLLRDRQSGTNRHRGGLGDDDVLALEPTRQPHTPLGILRSIEESANAFDRLGARWSPAYVDGRAPLLRMIEAARDDVYR